MTATPTHSEGSSSSDSGPPGTVDRIFSAARELLSSEGIEGFTIPAVAQRAGISRATIYNHFGSRDELVLRLLQDAMDRLVVNSETGSSNRERAVAVAESMVVAFAQTLGSPAASMSALTTADRGLQYLQAAIASEMTDRFRSALDLEQSEIVAVTLMWSTAGLLLRAGYGEVEVRELSERIASMTDVVLAGMN